MRKDITIVGSYIVGLSMKGERIPKVAETLIGNSFYEGGGGKGSNQKTAIVTLGAQGAVVVDAAGVRRFSAPRLPVPPVDSTGADAEAWA